MPIARYDRYFGKPGGASKALRAMTKEYGPAKARRVFYAMVNKRRGKR